MPQSTLWRSEITRVTERRNSHSDHATTMMTDVSATRGNNRQSSSCVVAVMELCVIGVLVAVNTAVWDDVYNRLQTANNTGPSTNPCGTPTSSSTTGN